MQVIPLTRGKEALVDDSDFEKLSRKKWFARKSGQTFYAMTRNGSRGHVFMHRVLLDIPDGLYCDHIDGNGLNNQRSNIRIATHQENMINRWDKGRNKSGFKGVSWKSKNNRWCAQICSGGVVIHLGLFRDPKDAAKAYDEAAVSQFGEFATTNKMLGLV